MLGAPGTCDVPTSVTGWVVKPIEIDDVPIVGVTLYSDSHSDATLRRVAEELAIRLQQVENTGRTSIVGGRPHQVHVRVDPQRLAGRNLSLLDIQRALRGADVTLPAGEFFHLDQQIVVDAGVVLSSPQEVADLVVAVTDDYPIYLRDVADVEVGPAEVQTYTQIGFGPAAGESFSNVGRSAAVTIAVAKKKGANAVWVSRNIQEQVSRMAPDLLPEGMDWRITRDYGKTSNDKVNELVEALAVAVVIVVGLLALVMGWREGLIVATAVPITFALTLLINYLFGYTINRVTLFALILALGLVVDDPIVDVENIYRHFKMRKQKALDAVLTAVNEVRPPIILATLAVIVSFVPLFFITGMMGPYKRPMALNVPLAMLMSMVVAFTITPWLSYHILKGEAEREPDEKDAAAYDLHTSLTYRVYARVTEPFLNRRLWAWALIVVTLALFGLSGLLVATRRVPLKMLPFDNKNEFQVVIDMPEGTTLQRTAAATTALAEYLQTVNEVTDVTSYVGTASPMDFNGLVRHYYLRRGSNVADIRVNLLEKKERSQQSHAMVLRLRHDLEAIADSCGANIKLVEAPPGPPVIATLAIEVYGQPFHDYSDLQQTAKLVRDRLAKERAVVDLDTTIEADQQRFVFETDKEKASLTGLSTVDIAKNLAMALDGVDAAVMNDPNEVNPTAIRLRLPTVDRSDIRKLENLHIASATGMVQLGEIGRFVETTVSQTIYHKNLRPVVYVFADTAGRAPAEVVYDVYRHVKPGGAESKVPAGFEVVFTGEGEWKITVDVFRDLGLAFAAACLGIYVLLVYETGRYFLPIILMISIPLTVIGIVPGFWLLNVIWNQPVGVPGFAFDNPVFFTATAMIGMIALSGIAVRNAILLIDFIHTGLKQGQPLRQAILESGAVRFRPIFLTAGTAMLAAVPITLDPIFAGLAWALIFGLFVSTAFTLLLIPVVYWMVYHRRHGDAR